METQAGVQWHPTASCLWPAQDWGQAGVWAEQQGACYSRGQVGAGGKGPWAKSWDLLGTLGNSLPFCASISPLYVK